MGSCDGQADSRAAFSTLRIHHRYRPVLLRDAVLLLFPPTVQSPLGLSLRRAVWISSGCAILGQLLEKTWIACCCTCLSAVCSVRQPLSATPTTWHLCLPHLCPLFMRQRERDCRVNIDEGIQAHADTFISCFHSYLIHKCIFDWYFCLPWLSVPSHLPCGTLTRLSGHAMSWITESNPILIGTLLPRIPIECTAL